MDRYWTDAAGKQRELTDIQLVESYLTGYIDHYSGGELEHLRRELENLRRNTAEALLAIDSDAVIRLCLEA